MFRFTAKVKMSAIGYLLKIMLRHQTTEACLAYLANEQLCAAEFEIDAEGRVLNVTEGYLPEFGRQPVVALVQSDPSYAARIREWAA